MMEIEEPFKLLEGEFFTYSSIFSTNLDALMGELRET